MAYVINAGNVDDIRNSLKHGENKLTLRNLRSDLEDEKNLPGKKRSAVIQLLVAAIKRKLKRNGSKSKPGVCKICLCTQMHACPDPETGTCYWVKEDLCSACASPAERKQAMEAMKELYKVKNDQSMESLQAFNTSLKRNFQ